MLGVHTVSNHCTGGENQDAYIATSLGGSKSLVGVFDGHGENGKRVSEFVRTQLAKSFCGHGELHSDPLQAFESAFAETQRQIERNAGFDAVHSGTTAVACYRHQGRLWTAKVGDLRAVLGCGDAAPGEEGRLGAAFHAIELSGDRRPNREDERRRSTPARTSSGAAPRPKRVGPERVSDRAVSRGSCVTRSLGDLGMRPFVTATPEVSEHQLGPRDRLLILGSDGVWDRISSQEAVDIAGRYHDPGAAARKIVGAARQRETQGHMSNDITAVVMHLD